MSKDSSSRKLLGTIKFVFDKTKSRTLNATQAYDTSTSQIVLASYPATSTIKGSAKGLGKVVRGANYLGDVGVTATLFPSQLSGLTAREEEVALQQRDLGAITLSFVPAPPAKKITIYPNGTLQFVGGFENNAGGANLDRFAGAKSNATKEIFAGNITVGTGLYRDWQNKYAVLKVDLLTNKAILRVYNE